MKICPRCTLKNPDTAERCECGYDFATGTLEKAYGEGTKPQRPRAFGKRAGASQDRRVAGFLVDLGALCVTGIMLCAVGLAEFASGSPFFFSVAVLLIYYVPLEAMLGRTLGKALLRTKVIGEGGRSIGLGQALGRTLARFIPFEPLSVLGSSGRMWHDRLTGTVVVSQGSLSIGRKLLVALFVLTSAAMFGYLHTLGQKSAGPLESVLQQEPDVARRLQDIAVKSPELAEDMSLDALIAADAQGAFDEVRDALAESPALLQATIDLIIAERPALAEHREFLRDVMLAGAKGETGQMEELRAKNPEASAALLAWLVQEHPEMVGVAEWDGSTPLFSAAWMGEEQSVRLLLEKGADPNRGTVDGWTPLHAAASQGRAAVAEALCSAGANPDARSALAGTPLNMAAAHGHTRVAQVLLEHGANANVANADGWTLLHAAAWHGQTEIVEMLMSHGAALNATDRFGRTPLDAAILSAHKKTAAFLRSKGGKTSATLQE